MSHIRGRMFELEDIRTWEKNPQIYADVLASSLATQALFTHASADERARRVLSKLRQAPRLDTGRSRQHQGSARYLRQGRHRDTQGSAEVHRRRAAASLFERGRSALCSAISRMPRCEASQALGVYIEHLESNVAPRARASFRLGRDKFEQKLKLEEGLALPVDRLLAIATRELEATQEAFRTLAGRLNGGDPLEAWARTKAEHPAPGELIERRPSARRRAR